MKILRLFLILSFVLPACSKPAPPSPNGTINPGYTSAIQLHKGSYWIYDNGDSSWMGGDTIINGLTFHVKKSTKYGNTYLRDSSGFILDLYNEKIFSATDFKDTLWKFRSDFGKMYSPDTIISVPAGSFKSIVYRSNILYPPGFLVESDYANGIGIIRQVRIGEVRNSQQKLVRYKIK